MEHKIGEIFEYQGEWYQCIVGKSCKNCAFNERGCYIFTDNNDPIGDCCSEIRTDKYSVIFKKLEKVGEPYMTGNKLIQRYKIYPTSQCINVYGWYYQNLDIKSWTIDIEIKQNKEDMKENNDGNTPLNELTDKYVNGNINYDEFEKEVKALYSCKKEDMEENNVQHYDCFFDKEQSKSNLKPFDLEAAKAGKPVCTRDGRKARIICFDRKDNTPIVALIECVNHTEILECVHNDGKCTHYDTSDNDLMMLPEKHERWMNVYRVAGNYESGKIYQTKKDAINGSDSAAYVATVKIEWEE